VNLVLDITGEEKVWFLFFKRIGYSDEEARKLLVGPAYWAWFCMANMYSYGGILPDEYLDRRVALANKNHEFMAKLGMKPCLMGYCGMVPDNIKEINSSAQIIHQGDWNKFLRPAMLRTNKKTYAEYAEIFYEVQREVLGDITNYFSTDPFHEGGIKGTISDKTVAKHILSAMKKEDENSVWVIQSWGSNPAKGLLKAVKSSKENVLILDLYAEKDPRFKDFRGKEFYDTPWIYCMLDNFGGKNGIHGHLDNLHKDIPYAINNSKCMKGIGVTPEGSNTNPFFTEFVFESIWNENPECVKPVNMKDWTSDYLYARYGKNSENANKCFSILCDTAFNSKDNGEGPEESIINARPALKIDSVSTWGHSKIEYDKNELVKAYELLIIDYDELKSSDAYIYDVTDIKRQVLANKAQDIHEEMAKAFESKDLNLFKSLSNDFLDVVLEVDSILSGRNEFSLDYWLDLAKNASEGLYEDTQKMFVQNAKRLITLWGDREHSEDGRLYDYSNRQWNGLTKDVYYKRWKLWINNRIKELEGQKPEPEDFFKMQNDWILKD
ncbi:MAG: alpha-N-acetylglucosaminidase TIM-barrel domain-containing protein, partial [Oscillospiraceae bacterium]